MLIVPTHTRMVVKVVRYVLHLMTAVKYVGQRPSWFMTTIIKLVHIEAGYAGRAT